MKAMTNDVDQPAETGTDTDAATETETETPAVTKAKAGPSRSLRWPIACAVLALLLVASLVGCFLLWQDRSEREDRAEAEVAATEEAERIVVAWLTYDYRTYQDDMTWVTTSGTDKFQEEYSPEALEGLRTKLIGPRQFVSRGRVVDSAATVEDDDTVKVLVFTDQTLTDKQIRREGGEPLHARSGVELTMVREGNAWLVDEMVQLQFQ